MAAAGARGSYSWTAQTPSRPFLRLRYCCCPGESPCCQQARSKNYERSQSRMPVARACAQPRASSSRCCSVVSTLGSNTLVTAGQRAPCPTLSVGTTYASIVTGHLDRQPRLEQARVVEGTGESGPARHLVSNPKLQPQCCVGHKVTI